MLFLQNNFYLTMTVFIQYKKTAISSRHKAEDFSFVYNNVREREREREVIKQLRKTV